jgi:hypothetical protein
MPKIAIIRNPPHTRDGDDGVTAGIERRTPIFLPAVNLQALLRRLTLGCPYLVKVSQVSWPIKILL